uniref:DDE Tnp4 domain-containing protein n=1 Tax=Leptobrachium leishanense TaxID=445787 RepID=A0A8C5LTW9_9ANUR
MDNFFHGIHDSGHTMRIFVRDFHGAGKKRDMINQINCRMNQIKGKGIKRHFGNGAIFQDGCSPSVSVCCIGIPIPEEEKTTANMGSSNQHYQTHAWPLCDAVQATAREGPVKFFNYLRMSIHSFEELLMMVREPLTKRDTNMRAAIPTEEMLVITLRYLASGCSLKDLHYNFRIGRSTAGEIVRKFCQTIWETMKDQCLPTDTDEAWLAIAAGFWEKANYPNCLGAVDGKHVRIVKPLDSGSLYQNYKHYFSIGLLAVADANYNFVYVDVGSYGKDFDSTLFQNSTLWNDIEGGNLHIPRPAPLPGSDVSVPYAFVGDKAFSLSTHLLRLYSGTHLTVN